MSEIEQKKQGRPVAANRTKPVVPGRRRGRPRKNPIENNWEDDFVFPIFCDGEIEKKITMTKNEMGEHQLSEHIIDLKNPIKEFPQPEPFLTTAYNPNDWFSNFQRPVGEEYQVRKSEDFFVPEDPYDEEKIRFTKPEKSKSKSKIKVNLTQQLSLESEPLMVPELQIERGEGSVIKRILFLPWRLATAPFRFLDFLVDRTLRSLWWFIKAVVGGIFNLFKSIAFNLVTILSGGKKRPAEVVLMRSSETYFSFKSLLTFVVICLIIVLPLQVLNWQQHTNQIKGQVLGKSMQGFEALKQASVASLEFDFATAGIAFDQAYFDFSLAASYLDNWDGVTKNLVKLVPEAQEANNLLIIGRLAAALGQEVTDLATHLEETKESTSADLKIIQKIEITREALLVMEPDIKELLERVNNIDIDLLAKYLDSETVQKLSLFKNSLPALQNYLEKLKELNNWLAEFLGQEGTKKYLVVFQNNSELRPTGGFMGSYALVEINKGKIVNLEVPGGGFYDLKAANITQVEAPKPFQLFSPYWQIWNANWWPHWPASAEKIAWFYERSLAGVTVDGVIALTPDVLENILDLTGAVELPEYEKVVNADNVVQELQMAVEVEYDKEENQPKKIVADLLPQIMERIFNISWEETPGFLKILSDNLAQKNILIWMNDVDAEQVVEDFSWGGKILQTSGDYLLVAHTNIGGGKTDRVVENFIEHLVEISENGEIVDTVKLTRTHQGEIGDLFEDENNVDYVRFYVPEGSELVAAEGFDYLPGNLFKVADNYKTLETDPHLTLWEKNPVLDEETNTRITNEFGKTVFGNWLQVEPGEEKTVMIKYRLPFKLEKMENSWWDEVKELVMSSTPEEILEYGLLVQKQPGLNITEFRSELNLPNSLQVAGYQTNKEVINSGNVFQYRDDLVTDGYYKVEFK